MSILPWMILAVRQFILTRKRVAGAFLLLFFLCLIIACSDPVQRRQLEVSGSAMGTSWAVKIIADTAPSKISKSHLNREINAQLERIDALFSTYREDSELSEFNSNDSLDWIDVSKDFVDVMSAASRISQLTNGAFDVTVEPLVRLWGFGPDNVDDRIPDQQTINRVLQVTGNRNIEIDAVNQRLRKLKPEISVDLSAIAKGYAVDQVALSLENLGVKEYLVEIGGELRAKGHNVSNVPWNVGIEVPTPHLRQVYQSKQLVNQAIATSGDYRNYFEINGQRFAHTINPLTGRPVEHNLASVTVIGANTMLADAWATALMVLGKDKGQVIAEQQELSALFISRTDDSFTDHATTAFNRR